MPLPRGDWLVVMNGTQGTLTINDVDAPGLVTGSLRSGKSAAGDHILGRWDEAGKRITFHTVTAGLPPQLASFSTAFEGYLFRDTQRVPGVTGNVTFTLVGRRFTFSDAGTTEQHEFGWYAQIGLV